jgi:hypothetical protein
MLLRYPLVAETLVEFIVILPYLRSGGPGTFVLITL